MAISELYTPPSSNFSEQIWVQKCLLNKPHWRAILLDTFTIENVLKFIAFNESPLKGHLWYLGAILYVLIIMHIFDKLKIEKCLVFAAPFLLMGDLILGKYSVLLLGREFPYILVRNFLFVGIPYFCIGRLIRNGFGQKVKKKVLTIFLIVFSATSLLERFALVIWWMVAKGL